MSSLSLNSRVLSLKPSATLGMKAKAKALSDQGFHVISFGAGEPDFETPACIVDAAREALNKGVSRYTPVRGTDAIIDAMRVKFLRDQGLAYASSDVMATVGAKAAIYLALQSLVGPGDEVIVFAPYWVSYPEQIRLCEAQCVIVETLADDNYCPTPEQLKKAITPKTKAVIFNSPNNPTGAVWAPQALESLMEVLKGTRVWAISDEIYEHLVFDDTKHVSPASFSSDAFSRTIVISGASKGYAMTGWRVGFVGGPSSVVGAMAKLQEQQYTCAPAITQAAAAYALLEPPILSAEIKRMTQAYQQRRDWMVDWASKQTRLGYFRPQGAFYIMLDWSKVLGSSENDEQLAMRLLQEAHVAVVPGTPFGMPGFTRLSLAASQSDLEEGTARLEKWLA